MKTAAIALLLSLALMAFGKATQVLIGYFRCRRYLRGVVPVAPMQVPLCLNSPAGQEQLAMRLMTVWRRTAGFPESSLCERRAGSWACWMAVADEVTRMFVVVGGERNDNGSQAGGAA